MLLLQVPAAHVRVVDDPELQDGMKNHWGPLAVMRHVRHAVDDFHVDTVGAPCLLGACITITHPTSAAPQVLAAQSQPADKAVCCAVADIR